MSATLEPHQEQHLLLFNDSTRKLISLTQDTYRVGRNLSNEIVIQGDPISRIHARLCKTLSTWDGRVQYEILDGTAEKPSINGVFVNNVRSASHLLQSGDVLSFANILKALYIQTTLNKADFERFKAGIISDDLFFGAFLEHEIAIAVESHLSNLEHTTIMLGAPSVLSKETLVL